MKRLFLCIILLVFLLGAASTVTTHLSSYQSFHSVADAASAVDTDLAAATGYGIGAVSGELDLKGVHGAGGSDTFANSVVLSVHATGAADGDTLTQKVYGRVDGGPPQLIASIVWTIGTARADGSTATYLWADTAVVTDTHITTVTVADGGGSNRVCSVQFDATGYRYIYGLFTAQTGDPTLCTCLYRVY